MVTTNFTAERKQKSYDDLLCSEELTGGRDNRLLVLAVAHSFLSVAAFLGNALILAALHKESSLHPPSKLLFRTLATTDLCVGAVVHPFYVAYCVGVYNERWDICGLTFIICHITAYILCSVSVFTMALISVDRLLALTLGLRYRQIVTVKRIYGILSVSGLASSTASVLYLWNIKITLWYGYSNTSLCLFASMFSYGKIFLAVRHNQTQVQSLQQQPSGQTASLSIARYRKTVLITLWVQLALVVCYMPYAIVEIVVLLRGLSPAVFDARALASTLVYLNSSLNPILYCWKIREVRKTLKDWVCGLFCP